MARTKKASNGQKNRKAAKQQQSSSIAETVSSTAETVSSTAETVSSTAETVSSTAETVSSTAETVNREAVDLENNHRSFTSSTIIPNSDRPCSGQSLTGSLSSKDESVKFVDTISVGRVAESSCPRENKKNESTGNATNGEANVNDVSAITDDLEISGVAALMTDDTDDSRASSRASSVIDLTESINETEERRELTNHSDQQQEVSTTAVRKSIRKPLKRLTCTATPRYNDIKERTSKGTPYIRKVSSSVSNEMKLSTGKKERIATEMKKSVNVKRVTFNNSSSMKGTSSTASKLNKKQSAVKMPNFGDIHRKMFEQMESIDVTVRKREERKKAASSKKENKGSAKRNIQQDTSTKSKKVVRKLDHSQPSTTSKTPQITISEVVNQLPKSVVQSKSFLTVPKIAVLQERHAVFKFTGNSKVVPQPLPGKKTVENRSMRRQQAYKARPVPKTQPQNQNFDRLKGVRLNRRFELQMKYREDQNEL